MTEDIHLALTLPFASSVRVLVSPSFIALPRQSPLSFRRLETFEYPASSIRDFAWSIVKAPLPMTENGAPLPATRAMLGRPARWWLSKVRQATWPNSTDCVEHLPNSRGWFDYSGYRDCWDWSRKKTGWI